MCEKHLNYVFESMLRFNDVNVKCKIMHGKRIVSMNLNDHLL